MAPAIIYVYETNSVALPTTTQSATLLGVSAVLARGNVALRRSSVARDVGLSMAIPRLLLLRPHRSQGT